ncbi:MAG: O-antigen/teichoic acid export membrane protein [Alteromonadaceae bacterium]|jgi:O-antigen/teichoic acid export membrane protein
MLTNSDKKRSRFQILITKYIEQVRLWFSLDIQELLSASFIIMLFKILGALCGFFVSVLITRQLSIADVGIYFLLMSFISIFSVVSHVGLENAITREVASYSQLNKYHQIKLIYHSALQLILIFGTLLGLSLFLFKPQVLEQLNISLEHSYYFVIVLPLLSALFSLQVQVFQGLRAVKSYAILNIITRPLHLLLLLALIFLLNKLTVFSILVSFTIALLMGMLLAHYYWRQYLKSKKQNLATSTLTTEQKSNTKSNLYALLPPMWLASLFAIVMEQGGQFFVGLLSTPQESALYGVAFRIALIVSFVVISFNNALAPKYAQLFSSGALLRLKQLYIKDTIIRVAILLPALLLLINFSHLVLSFFGERYIAANNTLMWLMLGYMINTITGPTGMLLMMANLHKLQRNNLFVSVMVLVSFAWFLIPLYGAVGAAQSVCLAMIINNVLGMYQTIRHIFSRCSPLN